MYLKNESEVSAIRTVYPEVPQKKRYWAVYSAGMVGLSYGEMFEDLKLVA